MRTIALAATLFLPLCALAQTAPPWSAGANDPASTKGLVFHVDDIDMLSRQQIIQLDIQI